MLATLRILGLLSLGQTRRLERFSPAQMGTRAVATESGRG